MSPKQTLLYFREWGKVRERARAQGTPAAECDAMRHALHQKALGYQRSSKLFTNGELDKVLAVFRAISRSGDLNCQIDAQQQPLKRRMHVLRALCAELGQPISYAEGIALQAAGREEFSTIDLDTLSEKELTAVIVALRAQIRRTKGKPPAWKRKQPAPAAVAGDDGDPFDMRTDEPDPYLLGIAVMNVTLPPGPRTQAQIAAFCGCTVGNIYWIEKRALKKLRRALWMRGDPILKEMLAGFGK